MGPVEHIDALRREGTLLAEVADEVGLHSPVPTCPTWTISDLLWHTGTIHRWGKDIVENRRARRPPREDVAKIVGPIPDDALLVEWYRESLAQLVRTLETTSPDLECWHFLPAPSALEFWTRRQAHETAIHRVDVESARGDEISPVGNGFAADGINELLVGFHGNPTSRVRSATQRVLRLHAVDNPDGADWYLHFSPDPLRTTRAPEGSVDCTLSGPVELLYLALWNRCRIDDLAVEGDATLVKLWQEFSAVEWPFG
ncbi:MAG TPA: maleylpyruvate isomerase family mycothiol-dependent enzyme [Candidatus Stackebrandtia excrementipullorum]|nr:maleylpyruvate isomerase family mycothiol-dependent enzyme [Candidatus Stackebrandtia excrementipullorum]